MPRTRHTLMETVAARLGWRRTYRDPAQLDVLLTEQSDTAYTEAEAAGHARLATAKNCTAQHVQPGVLDVRGRVLADVLYLEGVLTGARNRNLEPELLELLEAAVDHGHELTVLLAHTARTTAAAHTAGL
ncbi:hypothetical protein OG599_34760 (plasmid) [Streptomyces sp. NBC_01335]|uniref:hypothetical protein n=1 Tax=Streptomyces sp. NBC_01335 TaxID=2903828 RepID=UPI002E0ED39A|nr:hypothetical protein OG599_34760 [Streptomyces sp. NBC_01335]